jgi:anti-sigma B factor antagonist
MQPNKMSASVRKLNTKTSVIDIEGDVNSAAESALMNAYAEASSGGARTLILNFGKLEYMNSSGIGLLVTLLVRANRAGQKLMAIGLSDHYTHIFELTRLNEAIRIFDSESAAVAAATAAA